MLSDQKLFLFKCFSYFLEFVVEKNKFSYFFLFVSRTLNVFLSLCIFFFNCDFSTTIPRLGYL